MSSVIIFILFILLSSSGSLPPPRVSFLLNSADRRLVHFTVPGVLNTTTLLLSDDASTLYVGARNAILSLNVSQQDVISLKNKVEWRPSPREIKDCQDKGKNPTVDCPNFVRVLQPLNSTHLYACGSYAYSPHDAYIEADSLSLVRQSSGVKGRCPFNPFQRSTAIIINGELFTATMSDFRGVTPTISRHFTKDGHPDVTQDSSLSLLEEPVFVSSSLDSSERKLYFFFSEVGKEFSYINELRVARVAQVCKDDVGGLRTLQKKWTSFAKASLLCQPPKQLPFTILQDVFTLQPPEGSDAGDILFYGIFSSQWSSGSDSAVCVFKLQDVRSVFSGSYKSFDMLTQRWSPLQGTHAYLGQCGLEDRADPDLAEVKKSFLTSSIVEPVGNVPVVVSMGQSYSRVAAMRTQAVNGKEYTVLFLLTESGFLHKVVLLDQGARVIEEIQVFTQAQQVKSIVLSSSKGVLYVGTSDGVTAVPVANCSTYRTCSQCVLARDPLCGWSRTSKTCTSPTSSPSNMGQDVESGNVRRECQGQTRAALRPDVVYTQLNHAVRIQCPKPSSLSTVSWTFSGLNTLSENLFIQSADGSLTFVTTAATLGTYHCEAEEGGYKEVVASFTVRQVAAPRSVVPSLTLANRNTPTTNVEEIPASEEPTREPPEVPQYESSTVPEDETILNESIPYQTEEPGFKPTPHIDVSGPSDVTPTPRDQVQARKERLHEAHPDEKSYQSELVVVSLLPDGKSYHSELVVVSLLLVVCVCALMLGGFVMWRQRKTGLKPIPLLSPEDGSGKAEGSLESVPSLSPDGPGPKAAE